METLKAIGVALLGAAVFLGVILVQPEVPDTPVCMGDQPKNVQHGSNVVWTDCDHPPTKAAERWDPISRVTR